MNVMVRGSSAVVVSKRRPPSLSGGACTAHVYVDRVLMNRGKGDAFDVNTIAPDQVEAMEWYAGAASTPLQYASLNSDCGVLVIWTRAMRR